MSGLLATWRAAVAEAASNRKALASQMAVMFVNDAVWVLFWILFFRRVGEIRGWDTDTVLLLQAVLTSAGGIALGVLANARRIGAMAIGGELDAVLTLPVPALGYVLLRRIEPVNMGDLLFGVTLFLVAGHPTPGRAVVFVASSVLASVLLVSFLVLLGSTAFFTGRGEGGDLGFHAMLMTSAYPVDAFAGMAKVVLYSVVPAAFVASIPARLIVEPDPALIAAFVAVVAVFATAAWAAFTAGLRRYTSGSVWTQA